MQLMPTTARDVAKESKLSTPNRSTLLQPRVNVQLGSKYLRSVLDRYDDQQVHTTASCNVGPYRVTRWLPLTNKMSADVWVDTIPYDEMRKYVRRVMAYSTVYEWKMQQKTTRPQTSMTPASAK